MGGLVLPLEMKTVTVLELVQTVKNYAVQAGLDAIEFTCVPIWYMRVPNDAQGFALMASGFQLVNRWLLYIIPLFQLAGQPATVLLSDSKRRDVRQNLNKGVQPREVGLEKLDEFYDMLVESKAKQQATPTHTKEQLRDLMQRLPRRVRLFLCSHAGREIAGVLVFMLTEKVATTFYICHNDQFSSFCGPTVLVAHVMEKMAAEGLQYLSLGPTSFDDLSVHTGLAFFKEGMGGRAFCRDRWLWKRPT
jgi:lipid II:glycine glycyltransferase (peptidoglycan interpeptide bridge formation enzyme)